MTRVAYFGPQAAEVAGRLAGDLRERTGADVAVAEEDSSRSVVAAVEDGSAVAGVAPLEDGRLGTDRQTVDALVFEAARARVVGVRAVHGGAGGPSQLALLSTEPPEPTRAGRSLLFCVPRRNRPGTLSALLAPFATRGINLTKLESRPLGGRLGEYGFLVEVDAGLAEPALHDTLDELVSEDIHVKILGAYEPPLSRLGAVDDRPLPGEVLGRPGDVDRLRDRS